MASPKSDMGVIMKNTLKNILFAVLISSSFLTACVKEEAGHISLEAQEQSLIIPTETLVPTPSPTSPPSNHERINTTYSPNGFHIHR